MLPAIFLRVGMGRYRDATVVSCAQGVGKGGASATCALMLLQDGSMRPDTAGHESVPGVVLLFGMSSGSDTTNPHSNLGHFLFGFKRNSAATY